MAQSDVDLGFLKVVREDWRLLSSHFPSKTGGRPAWLGEVGLPSPEALACGACGQPCAFLLQLYAPYQEPRGFHRSIFLFCCRRPGCHRPGESSPFHVFRNQLPRKNDTYSYSPPPDTAPPKGSFSILKLKSGAHLCRVCGCIAPKACSKCHFAHYCCKPHQIVDWKLGHKKVCSVQLELSEAAIPDHSFLFPEYEILIEPELESEGESEQEADGDDEEIDPGSGTGIIGAVVECEDENALQAMAKKETKEDKIFECFKNKIASAPKQVLRYCRGGDPIWISCEHIPQETDIPNCSCGAKRIFEFQVMPQLLNHLNVDSLEDSIDWGTLAVFTCADNCGDEQQYTEEFLWKQDVAFDPV
ncbi:programmed cell death protein 2 [Ambystoma mexicanum]|uniref:programmed cell death protein 2 n=1 Tax=Ambystoma mexicanum TaxID=8296 RepID=UPI0037E801EE